MRNFWYRTSSYVRVYWSKYSRTMRRVYLTGLGLAVALIFLIPITLGIINPHVRLPDFHGGPPAETMREWERMVNRARREQSRMNDFAVMVQRLSENYPFFALTEAHTDMHYIELAVQVFNELVEEGLHGVGTAFFVEFINARFLAQLGGYGNPRLVSIPGYVWLPWIHQPYFFGYYDWRFYDERFDIPVRENIAYARIENENTKYVRIRNFIPKGYEAITREPFWYFNFEEDRDALTAVFGDLYGYERLVIDIRGIGSGFGEYFMPLVLAPLVREPVSGRFYAFHTEAFLAGRVSSTYREWYGLGETTQADDLTYNFIYELPENLTRGFAIDMNLQPTPGTVFDGEIWLITDSDNFSGPNFMYLQLARDAGFTIVYEENPDAAGWETTYVRLPSGLALRFNPLYFTDAQGRPLEAAGAFYDYRLSDVTETFDFLT